MQNALKSLVLVFCCVVLIVLVVTPQESSGFFGGVQVGQSRTIGGKNPLKERQFRRGNPRTRLYHNSSCPAFKSRQCTILFKSAEEARMAGFRPCARCGG